MEYRYLYVTGISNDIIYNFKKSSLFSWNSGGRRHWKFIVSQDIINHYDISKTHIEFNQECTWEILKNFLIEKFPDTFFFTDSEIVYIPKQKMGFVIGKKGWRIKEMIKIRKKRINLVPVDYPSIIYNWYGYGRYNMIIEKSKCNNCKKTLDDTSRLNSNFYKCNKCGSINYIK